MFQFLIHCIQATLSGYALYHASISIPNLQKYESKSEKAAKYSKAAAEQLQRTRSTQAVGAAAVGFTMLLSLISPIDTVIRLYSQWELQSF